MPNTRWWTFEDGRTNFGDVKPDTTDLAKLLLIEFGLVYANDWFLLPFTVPAGTIATVRGVAVTNVFGERTWIEAAGRGADEDWQRWAMFLAERQGTRRRAGRPQPAHPPAAQKIQEGPPLEDVMLVRDEMANMVWGIERHVPLADRRAKPGARRPPKRGASSNRRSSGGSAIRRSLRRRGRGAGPLSGDELGARELDSVHPGARARRQPRDPAAARGHAARHRRRSDPPVAGRPRTSLLRPARSHAGSPLLPARGGSAARGRACHGNATSARAGETAACGCGSASASRPAAAKVRAASRSIDWRSCVVDRASLNPLRIQHRNALADVTAASSAGRGRRACTRNSRRRRDTRLRHLEGNP